jgi:hypothetical protein
MVLISRLTLSVSWENDRPFINQILSGHQQGSDSNSQKIEIKG